MFRFVYNSKYCKEDWTTLSDIWDYSQFLSMYNSVLYYTELEVSIQEDAEREAEMQAQRDDAKSMIGRR